MLKNFYMAYDNQIYQFDFDDDDLEDGPESAA